MAKKPKPPSIEQPGPEWRLREEAAAVLGTGVRYLERQWLPKLVDGRDVLREEGGRRRCWIRVPAVIDLMVARAKQQAGGSDEDGGAPSDPVAREKYDEALARKTAAQAHLAELSLAEKRGELVNAREMREGLLEIAAVMKKTGETAQRRWGNECHRLYEMLLEETNRVIERRFGDAPTVE